MDTSAHNPDTFLDASEEELNKIRAYTDKLRTYTDTLVDIANKGVDLTDLTLSCGVALATDKGGILKLSKYLLLLHTLRNMPDGYDEKFQDDIDHLLVAVEDTDALLNNQDHDAKEFVEHVTEGANSLCKMAGMEPSTVAVALYNALGEKRYIELIMAMTYVLAKKDEENKDDKC